MTQQEMFGWEDTPLGSGAAPRGHEERPATDRPAARQLHLGDCTVCEGTGVVNRHPGPGGKTYCTCDAGTSARELDRQKEDEPITVELEQRSDLWWAVIDGQQVPFGYQKPNLEDLTDAINELAPHLGVDYALQLCRMDRKLVRRE